MEDIRQATLIGSSYRTSRPRGEYFSVRGRLRTLRKQGDWRRILRFSVRMALVV